MLPVGIYPYLNLEDLNLDYILKKLMKLESDVQDFVEMNAIKYADPIQWNITTQYEKNTIVIDPATGSAYLSVRAVPAGIDISPTEYWTEVFNLSALIQDAVRNLTEHDAGISTVATFASAPGEWIMWKDLLYVATSQITPGDAYTVGGNVARLTVEDAIKDIAALIDQNAEAIAAEAETRAREIEALSDMMESKIEDIENNISITPDSLRQGATDTDLDLLQRAINYAVENQVNIFLNRSYDITGGSVNINKGEYGSTSPTRRYNNVIRGGAIIKRDEGPMFTAAANSSDFYFSGVRFNGDRTKTYIFTPDVIRVTLFQCTVSDIKSIFTRPENSYVQSVRIINSTLTEGGDAFIDVNGCYDVNISNCVVEHSYGGLFVNHSEGGNPFIAGLYINNCVIEGMRAPVIEIRSALSANITDCYFERNAGNIHIKGTSSMVVVTKCSLFGNVTDVDPYLITVDDVQVQFLYISNCMRQNGKILKSLSTSAGTRITIDNCPDALNTTDIANAATYFPRIAFEATNNYDTSHLSNVHASVSNMTLNAYRLGFITTATFAFKVTGALGHDVVLCQTPLAPAVPVTVVCGVTGQANFPVLVLDTAGRLKTYGGFATALNNLQVTFTFTSRK